MSNRFWLGIFAMAFPITLVVPAGAAAQEVDYNRAERFLSWHSSQMISHDQVDPNWLEDGRRLPTSGPDATAGDVSFLQTIDVQR